MSKEQNEGRRSGSGSMPGTMNRRIFEKLTYNTGSAEVEVTVRVIQDHPNMIIIDDLVPGPSLCFHCSRIDEVSQPAVDLITLVYYGTHHQLRFPTESAKAEFLSAIGAEDSRGSDSSSGSPS